MNRPAVPVCEAGASGGFHRLSAPQRAAYNTRMHIPRRVVLAALSFVLVACQSLDGGTVQPPNVSLTDLNVRDIGMFEQRYVIRLRVQNPNPQPLPITGMAYRVNLNDIEFGRGVSRQSVTVPAYGETVVELDLVSSLWQLFERVRDLQSGHAEAITVGIVGDVNLANRSAELPFAFQGQLRNPLSSSGTR
jgi:LEA14-like dessication related protein